MMKTKVRSAFPFLICLCLTLVLGCNDDSPSKKIYTINGKVQKGPFQTGTTITVSELDSDLTPTGRVFYSVVTDQFGTFTIPDVELQSPYIDLMAEGYYFNERTGEVSDERLVLNAVADLSQGETININILTHVLQHRLKRLVISEEIEFEDAKNQAQHEVLAVFSMDSTTTEEFEQLDLTESGQFNNKLLAISSIILGSRKVSSLTALLTEMGLDIGSDGTLNDVDLQTELLTSAVLLDYGALRNNLKEFYDDGDFDSFEKYSRQFIENTDYTPILKFNFPPTAGGGTNLLALPDNSTIQPNQDYYIGQDLDENLLSQLQDFSMMVQFRIVSETTNVPYQVMDLTGWTLTNATCEMQTPCFVRITSDNFAQASKVPLKIRTNGTGELQIMIQLYSPDIPDSELMNGIITKYVHW